MRTLLKNRLEGGEKIRRVTEGTEVDAISTSIFLLPVRTIAGGLDERAKENGGVEMIICAQLRKGTRSAFTHEGTGNLEQTHIKVTPLVVLYKPATAINTYQNQITRFQGP